VSDRDPRHFFFYGTLQREELSDTARRVLPKLISLGRAFLPGRILAVKERSFVYPALLPALREGQFAFGTCFKAANDFSEDDLTLLDAYEAYFPNAPATSEYLREQADVTLESGGCVAAWCYFYHAPLPAYAEPIPSGDFLAYLAVASWK
jgi:gamma-glutamylcyclotransferase (GGCT)/AIG2-like uncharacterized protein YtfP